MTTYNFRDPNELLLIVENGKRSSFIRDAIEQKISMDKTTYNSQIEIKKQMLKYYTSNLEDIDEYINNIEREQKKLETLLNNMQKLRRKVFNKREDNMKEINMMKRIITDDSNPEESRRLKEMNSIKISVSTMLKKRHDENIDVNLDYLKIMGLFKSKLQFKKSLLDYITNIQEGTYVDEHEITREDIEYMKKIVEEY